MRVGQVARWRRHSISVGSLLNSLNSVFSLQFYPHRNGFSSSWLLVIHLFSFHHHHIPIAISTNPIKRKTMNLFTNRYPRVHPHRYTTPTAHITSSNEIQMALPQLFRVRFYGCSRSSSSGTRTRKCGRGRGHAVHAIYVVLSTFFACFTLRCQLCQRNYHEKHHQTVTVIEFIMFGDGLCGSLWSK